MSLPSRLRHDRVAPASEPVASRTRGSVPLTDSHTSAHPSPSKSPTKFSAASASISAGLKWSVSHWRSRCGDAGQGERGQAGEAAARRCRDRRPAGPPAPSASTRISCRRSRWRRIAAGRDHADRLVEGPDEARRLPATRDLLGAQLAAAGDDRRRPALFCGRGRRCRARLGGAVDELADHLAVLQHDDPRRVACRGSRSRPPSAASRRRCRHPARRRRGAPGSAVGIKTAGGVKCDLAGTPAAAGVEDAAAPARS